MIRRGGKRAAWRREVVSVKCQDPGPEGRGVGWLGCVDGSLDRSVASSS
jgi:hypothetical protein